MKTRSLVSLVAGLVIATVAMAAYIGFDAETGVQTFPGLNVSGGPAVVVTGTSGCGTLTLKAGGTYAGTVELGTFSSSCALTLTLPGSTAAPNGLHCTFNDVTTPGDSPTEASESTTACASTAGTLVTSDVITYNISAF